MRVVLRSLPLSPRRLALLLAASLTLGAAGCGSEEATVADQPASSAGADAYCAAMAEMAALQPAGSMTEAELETAMTDYADAVERAAGVTPEEEAETLRRLAEALRIVAVDPTAPGLAEEMGSLAEPMAGIALRASRECGIDFGPATS